jgi:hypothetical protein
MYVTYVFAGYEGSECDVKVLQASKLGYNDMEMVPDGYVLLLDAGYGSSKKGLTPYRGVRYHLKEWAKDRTQRPANAKEFYNLSHSKARNVVERTIGLLKKRWGVLRGFIDCDHSTVKHVIYACSALHNMLLEAHYEWKGEDDTHCEEHRAYASQFTVTPPDDDREACLYRAQVASTLWRKHCNKE